MHLHRCRSINLLGSPCLSCIFTANKTLWLTGSIGNLINAEKHLKRIHYQEEEGKVLVAVITRV